MIQGLLPPKGMTTMKAPFASPLLVASGAWSLTALWIDGHDPDRATGAKLWEYFLNPDRLRMAGHY